MKEFDTITDLTKDEYFIDEVGKIIDNIHANKAKMQEALPAGMRYKRDWYDRMKEQLNVGFFNANVESVVGKRSNLPSQTRSIISQIYNDALRNTLVRYSREESKTVKTD